MERGKQARREINEALMTGLSLFSGIGGIDLAFEALGGRVIAMCEKDSFCRAVLRKRWPNIPIFEDVYDLTGDKVRKAIGDGKATIDIVFGGFPCQPFSVAGKRKNRDDERYLWPEFSRLVGEIRPRWVVAENVPGIVKLAADAVCKDLERFGYSVGIWQYEAAAVGAPHKRLRVFFIGCLEQASETEKIFEDVPHPGCRMLQRGAVEGAFRGESGERPASDAERSGSSLAPAADRERREGQRSVESGLDRVVDGFSSWLDGSLWWGSEPDIPRTARSVPNRRNRLKALGNAVVPAQFYPIFKAIMKIEKEERMLRKRETARTI